MSTQKLKWETNDGRCFDSFEEAATHELTNQVLSTIGSRISNNPWEYRYLLEELLKEYKLEKIK